MPYNEFRLDAAALEVADNPNIRIVTYHFNIPVRLTPERATFERVLQQIQQDFPDNSQQQVTIVPYFQISAVYTLIHRTSGAERLWQGSMNPRSRERGQVTPFRHLNPANFVDFTHGRSQTQHVLHALNNITDQQNTEWAVSEILSVVVSVQTTVRLTHPVFHIHPQLLGHGVRRQQGRRQRRQAIRAVFRLNLE